jgi:hypothetical protein
MKEIYDFIKRNIVWLMLGLIAILLFKPELAEIKTILLVAAIESLALGLSGVAAYVYTKIDFTQTHTNSNLGFIFLGVHICIGLTILGVYLAQFGA